MRGVALVPGLVAMLVKKVFLNAFVVVYASVPVRYTYQYSGLAELVVSRSRRLTVSSLGLAWKPPTPPFRDLSQNVGDQRMAERPELCFTVTL